MKKTIIDVLLEKLMDEAIELYTSELMGNKEYKKLEEEGCCILDEIIDEFPESENLLNKLQDVDSKQASLEQKTLYKKGVQDGVKLSKLFNQFQSPLREEIEK